MSYKDQKLTEPKIDKPNSYSEYKIFKDCVAVKKALQAIIEKYKIHEVDNSSVPSAPDTSKFRASRSGKLQFEFNYFSSAGTYDFSRRFIFAVKIGSNIDAAIQEEIKEEIYKVIKPYHQYNGMDAGVHCEYKYGTNYDTYGLVIPDRVKFNEVLSGTELNQLIHF